MHKRPNAAAQSTMRRLAIVSGAFAAGIFLAQYLLPDSWLLPCAGAGLVVSGVCLAVWLVLHRNPGRFLFLAALGLSLAFGYNWIYVRQVQQPAEAWVEVNDTVTMTLLEYPSKTSYGGKVTVRIDGIPGKVVYYGDWSLLDACPGQTVTDTVLFRSAAKIREDEITNFTSKGVFLLAYQRGEAVLEEGSASSIRWLPARMGYAMKEQIAVLFDEDTAGFFTSMLTGDKTRLSVQSRTDLEEAGLYHILAVSGMHCGFLLLLTQVLSGRHRPRLRAVLSIPLLVFYALLTGGSPSIVRACVMMSFLLIAPVFRYRSSDGPTSLSAALLVLLLANPFAAASVSLQLSFGAVAGMLWLTPKLRKALTGEKQHGKLFHFTVTGFSATMGALVFTLPISAWYFGIVTLLSPLSNLLCLWAAGLAFLSALLTVLISFVCPALGAILAWVPKLSAGYILTVAHLIAKVPYHAVYTVNPYIKYWILTVYLLFFGIYLLRLKAKYQYQFAAALSGLALAAAILLGQSRINSGLEVRILDVGQGQSILFYDGETSVLVDCGTSNSWIEAGSIASDRLLTMGERKLDYLILTHFDSDHVNGVETLLARMDVAHLLVPRLNDEDTESEEALLTISAGYGTAVQIVEEQMEIEQFTIYPPVESSKDNERGLSILANGGEASFLMTGDMSSATEKKLLAAYEIPDLDYLMVGHHGSKYSTCDELLDALTPETAFISVGSNSYGHPTEEVLGRLEERGCAVYRTDLQGEILIWMN